VALANSKCGAGTGRQSAGQGPIMAVHPRAQLRQETQLGTFVRSQTVLSAVTAGLYRRIENFKLRMDEQLVFSTIQGKSAVSSIRS
jgi:hypothetical protein